MQTLARDANLTTFAADAFDYLVVDEFHHAQADTYLRVINHFKPAFLLGMTATPERMDGRDVLMLCDYNIVCDIRLREALSLNLLAPFHYFGLADETVDYEQIEKQASGQFIEIQLVKSLNSETRVDYIIEQIEKYTFSSQRRCALGFCVNRQHATFMSDAFNARNIPSAVLTGEHSTEHRQATIAQLQDPISPLQCIFTVDIFNEGVDIPQLNLLLFLRPTESSTIFIQQLGRGLRKHDSKEFVTVLDFIGNYQNSYMVPLALSGEADRRNLDKQALKRAVQQEFADLPAGCYVDLDEVAKRKIIEKLDSIRLDRPEYLKQLYRQFKRELGSSPTLMDFFIHEDAPNPTLFIQKFGSLYHTKRQCDDIEGIEDALQQDTTLQEIATRLEAALPIKWPYESIILLMAMHSERQAITVEEVVQEMSNYFNMACEVDPHQGLIMSAFKSLSEPASKMTGAFGHIENERFIYDATTLSAMKATEFHQHYLLQRLDYGLKWFRRYFEPQQFLAGTQSFTRYQNYSRNDIQFLSGDTAKKGTWREGVKRIGNHYFLFINLTKEEDVGQHLNYKDYFVDPRAFHWQSQNQTSHASTVGQNYVHHKSKQLHIHLFVRKRAKQFGMTLPFMYLGEVDYVRSNGDKPMNIVWKLHHAIPDALYEELIEL